MPFQTIKRNTDLITRTLSIIVVAIALLMLIQTVSEFNSNKRKTTELTKLLDIVQEQNKRSMEDRKILHEQNIRSIAERKELYERLNSLEGR